MTFYDAHRLPLRCLFTLTMRVEAEGVEHLPRTGGAVVVSNHLTDFDPFVLGTLFLRQMHFMAKEELFRGLVGWWLRSGGAFPVRRGEVDRVALKVAEDLLRAGHVVMIFPEGHRSQNAEMQAARSGAVLLASRAGCPIVPVAIAGTERLRFAGPPGETLARVLSRPRVRVRVGEPIAMGAGQRGRGRQVAADLLMRRITQMLPPAYHGVYSE